MLKRLEPIITVKDHDCTWFDRNFMPVPSQEVFDDVGCNHVAPGNSELGSLIALDLLHCALSVLDWQLCNVSPTAPRHTITVPLHDNSVVYKCCQASVLSGEPNVVSLPFVVLN